ncbi:MAG: helical backbone metal receptor [Polyangia bacterium]
MVESSESVRLLRPGSIAALLAVAIAASVCAGPTASLPVSGAADARPDRGARRIVSLVPSVTETLFAIGAGESMVGVTHHDRSPAAVHAKAVVGGFAAPSFAAIEALEPDLVIASRMHTELSERLRAAGREVVVMDDIDLKTFYERTLALGELTGETEPAQMLVEEIRARLERLARKLDRIPQDERLRVARLMGLEGPTAPGDDSFQLEYIRAAGGIPPCWGEDGAVASPSPEQWRAFDPEVIYACGEGVDWLARLQSDARFSGLSAVREGRVYSFPCALTCRTSVHAADFAEWLAATIYPRRLTSEQTRLGDDRVLSHRAIRIPFDYIEEARVVRSAIDDFEHRSLVLELAEPMRVLSSLEGLREQVVAVVNHGLHPAAWEALHADGPEATSERVCEVHGLESAATAMLHTGAGLENRAVAQKSYAELAVVALVTAGVRSNAMRAGEDEGRWIEPGTINIILLTSRRLTPRAMVRAVIAATEAKTAALQDLDVRSSYTPLAQATGTGTDNVVVIEGAGSPADSAGGHTKLGELIAGAVSEAVREAVGRQNALSADRSVFARLDERGLGVAEIGERYLAGRADHPRRAAGALERALLDPAVAGLVESALALADSRRRGLVGDLTAFTRACRATVAEATGVEPLPSIDAVPAGELPEPLEQVLEALISAALSSADRTDGEPAAEATGQERCAP